MDALRALEEDRLRHSSAERMTDHVCALHTRRGEPLRGYPPVPAQLVRGVGSAGEAVPGKVGHDDAPIVREPRRDVSPGATAVVQTVQEYERPILGGLAQFGPVHSNALDVNEAMAEDGGHAPGHGFRRVRGGLR